MQGLPHILTLALTWTVMAAATGTPVADFCQPCGDGAVCSSGYCVDNLCSQACNGGAPCPSGFSCNDQQQCQAADPNICTTIFMGATLGNLCYQPNGTAADPNATLDVSCAAGLTCFVFSSGVGECVPLCSSQTACANGSTCCYGTDDNGHCVTTPSSSGGGCFQLGSAGSSCVTAQQAICDNSTSCIYISDPQNAMCYHTCSGSTCTYGEACESLSAGSDDDGNSNTVELCCEQSTYSPSNVATCVPLPPPCQRNVGVICQNNNDCVSDTCLSHNGQQSCSSPCVNSNDCPAAGVDVNNDGIPDGGSTCITVNGTSQCWPVGSPVSPPACANTPVASGCTCQNLQTSGWTALVVLFCLRRRVRPKSVPLFSRSRS